MKAIRNNDETYDIAHNCLMCGRCDQICPVGIELSPIRMIQEGQEILRLSIRIHGKDISGTGRNFPAKKPNVRNSYDFLPESNPGKADVLYFAGCMTHLTPSIKNAMTKYPECIRIKLVIH